jgi:hypothetical protein
MWRTYYSVDDYGMGCVINVHTFDSVDEAVKFAEKTFGTKAENVVFVVK